MSPWVFTEILEFKSPIEYYICYLYERVFLSEIIISIKKLNFASKF